MGNSDSVHVGTAARSLAVFLYESVGADGSPPEWRRRDIAILTACHGWIVHPAAAQQLFHPAVGGTDALLRVWCLQSIAMQVAARHAHTAYGHDAGGCSESSSSSVGGGDSSSGGSDDDGAAETGGGGTHRFTDALAVADPDRTGVWMLPLDSTRVLYIVSPWRMSDPPPPAIVSTDLLRLASRRDRGGWQVPARRQPAARRRFVPLFRIPCSGNRSEAMEVGHLFSTAAAELVVAKTMVLDADMLCEVCFLPPGGPDDPVPPAWDAACERLRTLQRLRDDADLHHANVLRILDFDTDTVVEVRRRGRRRRAPVRRIRTYCPWMTGGTLQDHRRAHVRVAAHSMLTVAQLRAVCADAWDGLAHLNRTFLHQDVKPENILVEVLPDGGGFRGVLADLDDMVALSAFADFPDMAIVSTPGYGSPFPHGTVKRDQTAMLMATVHVLGPVSWHRFTADQLQRDRNRQHDRDRATDVYSLWGYAAPAGRPRCPDTWKHYRHGVYCAYAEAVRHANLSPADDLYVAGALLDLVELLDAPSDVREAGWDCAAVHAAAVTFLRCQPEAPACASSSLKRKRTTNLEEKQAPS